MKYPLDSSKISVLITGNEFKQVMKYVDGESTDEPVEDEQGRPTYRLLKTILIANKR